MKFELEKCPICGGELALTPRSLCVRRNEIPKKDWCWKCGKQLRIMYKIEQKGKANEQ